MRKQEPAIDVLESWTAYATRRVGNMPDEIVTWHSGKSLDSMVLYSAPFMYFSMIEKHHLRDPDNVDLRTRDRCGFSCSPKWPRMNRPSASGVWSSFFMGSSLGSRLSLVSG